MEKIIIVKKKSGTYQIPIENIIYMEKDLRRIAIHLRGMKEKEVVVYETFGEIIPQLDERFMCCYRSFIINMDEITVMSSNEIILSSNEGIYFGRDTYRKAYRIFKEYMRQKRKEIS